jgi:hypothetical protein
MRVLFDQGTPIGIAGSLSGHEVTEVIGLGWDRISNGELLNMAESEGFDLRLTTDKRIRYQQNLTGRKIAIVVLGNSTWRVVRLYLHRIALAVNDANAGQLCRGGHTVQVNPVPSHRNLCATLASLSSVRSSTSGREPVA